MTATRWRTAARWSLLPVTLLTALPGTGRAERWVLRAGVTREYPQTTGPDGYGNHGKFDGTNAAELDRADRRYANWDQAPGLVVELARKRAASWTAPGPLPLSLALEPYARLTLVDTEFNETQRDWVYLTQTFGGRAIAPFPGLPWLALHAGAGAGGGHVARRTTALWEAEYGLEAGPLRGTWARQFLEGGREVRQLYLTFEFSVGEEVSREPFTRGWSLGAFSRITQHPSRRVKSIHQTGAGLTRHLSEEDGRCLAVELEVSTGPVESRIRRPLNEEVEHNYRTQDEMFWALYFGERRPLGSRPGLFLEFRAGLEVFYQDDDRVNPDRETGWFPGAKVKAGLWKQRNRLTAYGVNAVVGVDTFGFAFGAELAIATWL